MIEKKRLLILLLLALPLFGQAQVITTFAGGGTPGILGDGAAATAGSLLDPNGVCADRHGNIIIADMANNRLRRVDVSGIITTVAGTGVNGHSGDGGPATNAKIGMPESVCTDTLGNIYFAEYSTGYIRKVDAAGIISTIGGGGMSMAENVPATSAMIAAQDLVVDYMGNVYFTESGSFAKVRKINLAGNISTLAGNGTLGHSGDGGPATAAQLGAPLGITIDNVGNIYITDGGYIRKINTAGIISAVAGNGGSGYTGDGGAATVATFNTPTGIVVDNSGNMFIGDRGNNVVRRITSSGVITTYAGNFAVGGGFSGDGGPATAASLAQPTKVSLDNGGNLLIADAANNRIRRINNPATTGLQSQPYADVCISPDPATDHINIKTTARIEEVRIYNMNGQLVYKANDLTSNTIDVTKLEQGMFSLLINDCLRKVFIKIK